MYTPCEIFKKFKSMPGLFKSTVCALMEKQEARLRKEPTYAAMHLIIIIFTMQDLLPKCGTDDDVL